MKTMHGTLTPNLNVETAETGASRAPERRANAPPQRLGQDIYQASFTTPANAQDNKNGASVEPRPTVRTGLNGLASWAYALYIHGSARMARPPEPHLPTRIELCRSRMRGL